MGLRKMKCFLALVLLSSAAFVSAFEEEEQSGLCLDPWTLHAICIAGSSLQEKMETAFNSCSNVDQVMTRKNGKGKGKKCPTFEEIMSYVEEEYAEEGCIMQSIGWLDDNFQEVNSTIMADMESLNPELTSLM